MPASFPIQALRFFLGTLAALSAIGGTVVARADFSLTPGHYYTANYFSRVITEHDAAGNVAGSLTLPAGTADEIRGLAFGADGLLYATAVRGSGFAVLALDSTGAVQSTYAMSSVYVAGNLSYGKIALDGTHIYVAGANQVIRFDLGNPNSGTTIYTGNQLFDVEVLPSGNLLAASAYSVDEITPNGVFVRTIAPSANFFTDVRGIEFNPATNDLFVTELGNSSFGFFQLLRLDAASGALEDRTTFEYADDLFLSLSGDLLVGSRTQSTRFYTQDLDQDGTLGGGQQMFVTQYAVVPEPTTAASAALAAAALWLLRCARRSRSA